jgi:nucleotide-binding universal stress UspA family protein
MEPDPGPADRARGGVFRRILVGYDGSMQARQALRIGIALAADVQGEAQVLLVVRPPAHVETPHELEKAAQAERENLSQGLRQIWGQMEQALDVVTHVVFDDDPAKAMAAYVEEHGFDLVVVGSHGREQTTHRGAGHSLEALLRRHPCPILVV